MKEKYIPLSEEVRRAKDMMTNEQKESSKEREKEIDEVIGQEISRLEKLRQEVIDFAKTIADTAKSINPSAGERVVAGTINFDEAIERLRKFQVILRENNFDE